MILVAEFEIMRALVCGIEFYRSDLQANSLDETKSVLYKNFGKDMTHNNLQFENASFFTQVKELISKSSRRRINVNLGFSLEKFEQPTFHVMLFDESPAEGTGIGYSEGYALEENGGYDIDTNALTYRPRYSNVRECIYDIVMTSTSNLEVILMQHLLETLMVGMVDHLSLKGMMNIQYAVKPLEIDLDIIPIPTFHRRMQIKFTQDKISSSFFTYPVPPTYPLNIFIGDVNIESVN